MFKSDTVPANGLAKSLGKAESATEVPMVVPENFMIVFWLSSKCARVSCMYLDSGIIRVSTAKEKTMISAIDRILMSFSFENFKWHTSFET